MKQIMLNHTLEQKRVASDMLGQGRQSTLVPGRGRPSWQASEAHGPLQLPLNNALGSVDAQQRAHVGGRVLDRRGHLCRVVAAGRRVQRLIHTGMGIGHRHVDAVDQLFPRPRQLEGRREGSAVAGMYDWRMPS